VQSIRACVLNTYGKFVIAALLVGSSARLTHRVAGVSWDASGPVVAARVWT